MDALTVLIIAVVVFTVFVLLTAYALKMAVLMGREARSRTNSVNNKSRSEQENSDEDDPFSSK
ncbi:hypothetical protein [Methanolobus zinderi]|uniref:hypothetical protein n=1 Tax=Methanolobus zinderi TaxID=536044 RepID=UPI001C433777|nr:hypothetical protein [Methanolobus zinderi]